MTTPHKLSPENRQLVRDIVAGLEGYEKRKEAARVRSMILRMDEDYRRADNARQATLERNKYGENLEEGRRKAAAKARQRRARMLARTHGGASAA